MNLEKIEVENLQYLNNIKIYDEIPSTHIEAKKMGKNRDKEAILIAENQTAGIGTKGRTWISEEGKNIAMSILLYPKCNLKSLDGLTINIAEIIKNAIFDLYGYELKIKEPNDLILNKKKICGILTETSTIGDNINYLIISYGFNVNENTFPDELENIATSLKKEFNKDFKREEIISEILKRLEKVLVSKKII